jgi:hypothetical protein
MTGFGHRPQRPDLSISLSAMTFTVRKTNVVLRLIYDGYLGDNDFFTDDSFTASVR